MIPGDGEVIEGVASVDESAITGESAPVIRESGGDRSAVTGGTHVLSDWLVVRVTREPGRDLPRSHDRDGRGREAQEDAERDRARHPARGPDDRLPARDRHAAAVLGLRGHVRGRGRAGDADRARRAARVPDPDDDRRPALRDRHRRHGPHDPGERDRDVRPRGRGRGRRRRAAARQDRHDHARQPPGDRVPPGARRQPSASSPRPRSSRRSPTRRPRAAASSCWRRTSSTCAGATCTRSAPPSCRSPRRRA